MGIVRAETYGPKGRERRQVVARVSIAHPLADEVSMNIGDGSYARFPYSVELAFFANGEWVEEILWEFEEWTVKEQDVTRVYSRVPLVWFAQFVEAYGDREAI